MHFQVHAKCWHGVGGPHPPRSADWNPDNGLGSHSDREVWVILEAQGGTRRGGAVHAPPGEGRTLRVWGELVAYKVTCDRTGGAYSLFEVASRPGTGPPPHVQHQEDEAFWVLEGEYEFTVDGRVVRAGAGSLLYVPRGGLHAHENVGEGVARMLVVQTPGGLHERFYQEVGAPTKEDPAPAIREGQPDAKAVSEIAVRYGIEIPPLESCARGQGPG